MPRGATPSAGRPARRPYRPATEDAADAEASPRSPCGAHQPRSRVAAAAARPSDRADALLAIRGDQLGAAADAVRGMAAARRRVLRVVTTLRTHALVDDAAALR